MEIVHEFEVFLSTNILFNNSFLKIPLLRKYIDSRNIFEYLKNNF